MLFLVPVNAVFDHTSGQLSLATVTILNSSNTKIRADLLKLLLLGFLLVGL